MGSIEQLPSGRYRAYAWNAAAQRKVKVTPDVGRSFASWEEADAAVKRRERELDGVYNDAGLPVQRQGARYRFRTVVHDLWLPVQRGQKQTRSTTRNSANTLCKTFGDDWFDEISRADVLSWLAAHEEVYAPNTVSNRLVTLRKIMDYGCLEGLRSDNPCKGLSVKEARIKTIRFLDDAELDRVASFLPAWLRPAALLAFDSGLRRGEFTALRWFRLHLDTAEPEVDVADMCERDGSIRGYPKGKVASRIPLTERTAEALRELRDTTAGGAGEMDRVFWNPSTQRPANIHSVGRIWHSATIAAGLHEPPATWHHLRHSCARRLALAGASAMEIQAMLRHQNLTTSQRYLDAVAPRKLRDVMTTVLDSNAAAPALDPVA